MVARANTQSGSHPGLRDQMRSVRRRSPNSAIACSMGGAASGAPTRPRARYRPFLRVSVIRDSRSGFFGDGTVSSTTSVLVEPLKVAADRLRLLRRQLASVKGRLGHGVTAAIHR